MVPVSIVIFIREMDEKKISVWMQKRTNAPFSGLWEFPGGKIEEGELPEEAACREVLEETGVSIKKHDLLLFTIHSYNLAEKSICLYVYMAMPDKFEISHGKWFEISYEGYSGFLKGKIPEVNHYLIDLVTNYFEQQGKVKGELWNLSSGG
ncbi:MAG: NUDIX domain-containing protein [Halobacteriovoraceae bacterium]|nr:NUDIX domain-containing protein [Halobacteriovoraceae bacterium]